MNALDSSHAEGAHVPAPGPVSALTPAQPVPCRSQNPLSGEAFPSHANRHGWPQRTPLRCQSTANLMSQGPAQHRSAGYPEESRPAARVAVPAETPWITSLRVLDFPRGL